MPIMGLKAVTSVPFIDKFNQQYLDFVKQKDRTLRIKLTEKNSIFNNKAVN